MNDKLLDLDFIKKTVEQLAKVDDISINSRKREVSSYRFIFCQLCREFSANIQNYSLASVGRVINRNHATVLHAHKKFEHDNLNNHRVYQRAIPIIYDYLELQESEEHGKEILNNYYRLKHIRLSEKYRSVINNLRDRIDMIKSNDLIDKISKLNDSEIKELEIKLDAFFKVSESRKKQY